MLKTDEIRELIKVIDKSSIDEFKFEQGGSKLTLKKQGRQVIESKPQVVEQVLTTDKQPETVPEQTIETKSKEVTVEKEQVISEASLHKIVSPMVGTFYASPSPDAGPYVSVNDKIKADKVVCIVEAMKLMNEIEAEVNGKIVEVLVENGQLVEYGQPLFLVERE